MSLYQYNEITDEICAKLEEIVGKQYVISDREKMEPYSHDEVAEKEYSHMPDVVVKPRTAGEIADIVRQSLDVYQRPIYLVYIGARPLPDRLLPPGARLITNQLNKFSETESAYHIPKKQRDLKIGLHLYAL